MLKKFELRNYKNFDDISIDLQNISGYQFSSDCITDGIISKMLIYGRNATGKTNLGKAFMDINNLLLWDNYIDEGIFLNADSTEDHAAFSYTFQFDDNEIIYRYTRFSNQDLRDEELRIDGVSIYRCDFFCNEYEFSHLEYIKAETANVKRYIQSLKKNYDTGEVVESKLSFLRWMINNVGFNQDSLMIRLAEYVSRMRMITVSSIMRQENSSSNIRFFEMLGKSDTLLDLEEFLNAMGIACRLVLERLPDGQKELYFFHNRQLVPFYENASSGTLALVNLYRDFVSFMENATFMYLDEYDAFYHYEMAEKVIRFLKKKYHGCQIILTSHNTNLMTNRLMRPDCLFILSRQGTLTALCNATSRELREGHNLEKMYISGEFEKYE